jgi:hypothetical protein
MIQIEQNRVMASEKAGIQQSFQRLKRSGNLLNAVCGVENQSVRNRISLYEHNITLA